MITVIDAMNAKGQDWECSEVLRAEVRRLRADLAAAEQRATDAETALLDIIEIHRRHPGDTPLRMVDRARTAIVALTAPATQPDERAAAERTLLDRLAKRILAEIVYCAPENRALAEEIARVAKIETDLIVARYGDTDGAAKEGA